ncbi:hypothetical protein KBY29_10775 [Ruegeria pomeroyi]|nr:hypothetical protein [Ruegeria pomeroyi]
MKPLFGLLAALLTVASCTQDIAVNSASALFPTRPKALIEGFAAACSEPSETLRRPDPGTWQCWVDLPADLAAAAIVDHDGTLKALPQLVVQLQVVQTTDGRFLATLEDYLNVPQASGSARRIASDGPGAQEARIGLLRDMGGQIIGE